MKLKLPRIKPKIPYVSADKTETFIREIGLILFFCMFGVGLWWVSPSLCFIICGLMGMFFCYPRQVR